MTKEEKERLEELERFNKYVESKGVIPASLDHLTQMYHEWLEENKTK